MYKRGDLVLNDTDAGASVGASARTPGESLNESRFTRTFPTREPCGPRTGGSPCSRASLDFNRPADRSSSDLLKWTRLPSSGRCMAGYVPAKGRIHRRRTLEEVAAAAGVSRATPSRVFTARPRVSDEARRTVEQAARHLGCVPNRAARRLVTGRSDSVEVVTPEPTTRLSGEAFFSSVSARCASRSATARRPACPLVRATPTRSRSGATLLRARRRRLAGLAL